MKLSCTKKLCHILGHPVYCAIRMVLHANTIMDCLYDIMTHSSSHLDNDFLRHKVQITNINH